MLVDSDTVQSELELTKAKLALAQQALRNIEKRLQAPTSARIAREALGAVYKLGD